MTESSLDDITLLSKKASQIFVKLAINVSLQQLYVIKNDVKIYIFVTLYHQFEIVVSLAFMMSVINGEYLLAFPSK